MKTIRNATLLVLLWLLTAGIAYYLFLPAFNIHSMGFYMYMLLFVLLPAMLICYLIGFFKKSTPSGRRWNSIGNAAAIFGIAIFIILILLQWFNSTMFNAKKYASILTITEADFTQDIDEATALNRIALMDTDSARILGNREIGSLSDVVSQYEVSYDYTQIDLNETPTKVSALEYAGFFKYLANKKNGIPGYVKVDPVAQNADYVTLSEGMHYVPSSYFQKDLTRHLRFQYPTKIFRYAHFEVDEEGKPYYIASVVDYTIGIFGGQTISGAVICDPVTGECTYYDAKEIPQWADVIFDGDLLTEQYNWYGKLSGGFFNSILAKKGCKKCTETITYDSDDETTTVNDYGYIAKDGDIWIYTGVTSVNDDSSNIGFIMVNERTSEAHYFSIAGADENSAMASAEGEVQEKGYNASFPSLINVNNQPTYVMLLKDSNGIAKLFAMVNVEQYNIVATASTLDECFTSYQRKLAGNDFETDASGSSSSTEGGTPLTSEDDFVIPEYSEEDITERSFAIKNIQYVTIGGNTYVYLTGGDGGIYKQKFADNERLVLLNIGDSVTADCVETKENIWAIVAMK